MPEQLADAKILLFDKTGTLTAGQPTVTEVIPADAHVDTEDHLIRRLGTLLDQIDPQAPSHDDLQELRRVLYGLHAILVLHFTQADESYLSLADEPATSRAT